MANLLDILNSDIGKTLINGTSQQLGHDENKVSSAMGTALPLILGAMKNNSRTDDGANGLLNALGKDKHNGGILDNLGSIMGGSNIDNDVLDDGAGILSHVFGGKEENVAGVVSKSSGIDLKSAMQILKVAAPFVMGYLGKQKRKQNISNGSGMDNLLGGLLGGSGKKEQSIVESLLDAEGDGSIIDDVAGMILKGGGKNKGGIGGLLSGFLK